MSDDKPDDLAVYRVQLDEWIVKNVVPDALQGLRPYDRGWNAALQTVLSFVRAKKEPT